MPDKCIIKVFFYSIFIAGGITMCGIVGYAGKRDCIEVLLGSLKKLEYRGYDSAGVAYIKDSKLELCKRKGKLAELESAIEGASAPDTVGIGHTRWATHGEPSTENSHPHLNMAGDIAVVHNGIIENYASIKKWLMKKGVEFRSETDTEVIVHLVNYYYEHDLAAAVHKTLSMLSGSYALAVVSTREPGKIVAAKKDSPLIIGKGNGENIIASDIPALLDYTKTVYFMDENDIAVITEKSIEIYDKYFNIKEAEPVTVDWDVAAAEKGGYEHFMMKEIEEQPRALADTFASRFTDAGIDFTEAGLDDEAIKRINKIYMVACGTAHHACIVAKYVTEKLCRIPVETDIASEFRYRDPIVDADTFVVLVSQSGETADTIAALRLAKSRGAFVFAIVNVLGSTIAREADAVLYTHAGPEIAVASTKAYTTQLLSLYMLAFKMAHVKGMISDDELQKYISDMKALPDTVTEILSSKRKLQHFASRHFSARSVFYMGRGLDNALSMEGSLKLKEISYIHSESYAAGELKHGTIALIEDGTLVVAVLTQEALFDKCVSNIQEITARGATVLGITQQRFAKRLSEYVTEVVAIPDTDDMLSAIPAIVPMQLFAYFMAVQKGLDVDKPRNLAKSVTVE